MDYLVYKFTGSFDSVNNRSFLSASLKRIANFKDRTNSLYNSVVTSKTKVNLEVAKNERFEVLKFSTDDFSYYIVKGKKYTLECGTSTTGAVPNFFESKKSKEPNLGFRSPNIGFVLTPAESTIFIEPNVETGVPGDGCGSGDCVEVGFLDAATGYIAKGRFTENPKSLYVGGRGFGVNRTWTWNGQDINYVEKAGDDVQAQATWKFVSRSTESRPWNKFQDILPKGLTSVAVESEPGKRYAMDASKIDDMEKEVQRVVKENARLSGVGSAAPKSQPISPFVIAFGVFITLFLVFALVAILKKR
jgi:hypothetical protein